MGLSCFNEGASMKACKNNFGSNRWCRKTKSPLANLNLRMLVIPSNPFRKKGQQPPWPALAAEITMWLEVNGCHKSLKYCTWQPLLSKKGKPTELPLVYGQCRNTQVKSVEGGLHNVNKRQISKDPFTLM